MDNGLNVIKNFELTMPFSSAIIANIPTVEKKNVKNLFAVISTKIPVYFAGTTNASSSKSMPLLETPPVPLPLVMSPHSA